MSTTEQKPAPWYAAFPPPVSKPDFITREETRKLFETKTVGKDFILVDVRRTDFEVCPSSSVHCTSAVIDAGISAGWHDQTLHQPSSALALPDARGHLQSSAWGGRVPGHLLLQYVPCPNVSPAAPNSRGKAPPTAVVPAPRRGCKTTSTRRATRPSRASLLKVASRAGSPLARTTSSSPKDTTPRCGLKVEMGARYPQKLCSLMISTEFLAYPV